MNTVIILGTITKEIEVKYTQSGAVIASFSVAYNERYKDKTGQQVDKAMFFDVTAFGKQGETINQYFHKGSRILIEGSLDFQSWKTQDGSNRSKVGIKLNGFTFVDRKSDNPQPSQAYPQASPQNNMDDPNRHNGAGAMNRPAQHQTAPQTVPGSQIPLEIDDDIQLPF